VAQFAVARDELVVHRWPNEHPFAHRRGPRGGGPALRPLVQTAAVTYRLSAPFHLRLRIDFVAPGPISWFFNQPETDGTVRLFTNAWRDDLDGDEAPWPRPWRSEVEVLQEDSARAGAYLELVLPRIPRRRSHTRATAPRWTCDAS